MKTTLIAVSGMSPAIITETLWALSTESPAVVPDEVVIITTTKGEKDIREMLLTAKSEWGGRKVWEQLRTDIFLRARLPAKTKLLQLSVHVIDLPDEDTGVRRKAEDLRTRVDNDEAANFIVRIVANHCRTEDTLVIASIAGGRKTMGALLYAAMSLTAKESDRVTHVLVSEPFEFCRGFFYPDQPVQELTVSAFGKPPVPVRAADGKVEMADIPFVPLRNKFTELNEPVLTFAGLVEAYSRAERKDSVKLPVVTLDAKSRVLKVNGRSMNIEGRQIPVYSFLLWRAKNGQPRLKDQPSSVAPLNEFIAKWSQHSSRDNLPRLAKKLDAGDIARALSDLRKWLRTKGLRETIEHLAPERGRVGFEVRSGTD